MTILTIIHGIIAVILSLSAYLLNSKKYLNWVYIFIITVMVSWLLFKRCLLWDLQVRYEKKFNIEKDCFCFRFKDRKRFACRCLTSTIVYLNLLLIGYKLNRLLPTLLFLLFYIIKNGYLSVTDDNLSKYKIKT